MINCVSGYLFKDLEIPSIATLGPLSQPIASMDITSGSSCLSLQSEGKVSYAWQFIMQHLRLNQYLQS